MTKMYILRDLLLLAVVTLSSCFVSSFKAGDSAHDVTKSSKLDRSLVGFCHLDNFNKKSSNQRRRERESGQKEISGIRSLPSSLFKQSPIVSSSSSFAMSLSTIDTSSSINELAQKNNNNEKKKKKKKQKRKNTAATSSAQWIACASTKEMTRAVTKYVQNGDTVAEIGAQLRDTSHAIKNGVGKDGYALFVDVQRKFPTRGTIERDDGKGRTNVTRRKNDAELFCDDDTRKCDFVEIPSFEEWRRVLFWKHRHHRQLEKQQQQQQAQRPTTYDVLVVDVPILAGNDLDLTCVSLIHDFLALNDHQQASADDDTNNDEEEEEEEQKTKKKKCRVVIIKSGSLQNLAKRLIHSQRLFDFGVDSLPTLPKFALKGGGGSDDESNNKITTIQTSSSSGKKNEINTPSPAIIGTLGVEEYRRTIPYVVHKGYNVLEVGCHHGTTTAILHEAASLSSTSSPSDESDGNDKNNENEYEETKKGEVRKGGCLGIDIGPNIIKGAKKRYPHVPFSVGDAWRTADLLMMKEQYLPSPSSFSSSSSSFPQYDAVYVDVGGLSGSDGLLESLSLLTALGNALRPKCIVIKSLCVKRLASSLVPFSAIWWKEKQQQRQQDENATGEQQK